MKRLVLIICFSILSSAWTALPAAIAPASSCPPLYAEEEIIHLCNEARASYGISPLAFDWEAARVARHKTEDMMKNNYFGHDSPTFGNFFDMLKNFNILYKDAGENIAVGLSCPRAVVDAWMAQPGHRANILSEAFTHAGVGYSTDSNNHYWVLILLA